MLGRTQREEFRGNRLKGTAIDLSNDTNTGAPEFVIVGMTANLCREGTGRNTVEKGYDETFLSDAIGVENMIANEAFIRVNCPLIPNAVMEVDEFIAALRRGQTPRRGPQ